MNDSVGRNVGHAVSAPIAASLAISTVGSLPVLLAGAFTGIEEASLRINQIHAAISVAVYFVGAGISAMTLGRLSDQRESTVIMQVGLAGTAVGSLVVGISTGWPIMVMGLVLAGMGYGLAQPAVSRFLSDSIVSGRRGLAFGLRQAGVPAATILAGLAESAVPSTLGWRMAYFTVAMLVPLTLVVASRYGKAFVRPGPRTPLVIPDTRRSSQRVLLLAGSLGLGAATIYAATSFTVPVARTVGFSASTAGVLAAAGGALALTMRIAIGALRDKAGFDPLLAAGAMILGGVLGYLMLSTGRPGLFVAGVAIVYSLGCGWNALLLQALAAEFPSAVGKTTGAGLAAAFGGGLVGPLAFGTMITYLGMSVAWTLLGLIAAVAGVGMLLSVRLRAP